MDKKELRYLCKSDELPEYPLEPLESVFDKILKEYDDLNGEHKFTQIAEDIGAGVQEVSNLIILKCCFELMLLGVPSSLEILSNELGITYKAITVKNLENLRKRIAREETRIKIDQATQTITKGTTYVVSVVNISNVLGRQIDPRGISVSEYIALTKESEELIKAKKDGQRNTVK